MDVLVHLKPLFYQWQGDDLLLRCHIQAGSKEEGFSDVYDERIKIRIKAAAVDGKANKALITFLAK